MNKYLYILFILALTSCQGTNIGYYQFDDVILTRIETGNTITLYYGRVYEERLPSNFIEIDYAGFDGLVDAYLIFHENAVEVIPVAGSFKQHGVKGELLLNEDLRNIDFINMKQSIQGDYNNVYHLSNILEKEKEWNLLNNSKVRYLTKVHN